MSVEQTQLIASVAADYKHYDKFIYPDDPMTLKTTTLKWYNLAPSDAPVPPEIRDSARAYVEQAALAGNLEAFGELGFVILHRCGDSFYFLLVNSWRNNNELWESVYAKDGPQPDFQPFTFNSHHRGTFCVWELAAVWHEQQAWKRFLASSRDEAAKQAYLHDLYQGIA